MAFDNYDSFLTTIDTCLTSNLKSNNPNGYKSGFSTNTDKRKSQINIIRLQVTEIRNSALEDDVKVQHLKALLTVWYQVIRAETHFTKDPGLARTIKYLLNEASNFNITQTLTEEYLIKFTEVQISELDKNQFSEGFDRLSNELKALNEQKIVVEEEEEEDDDDIVEDRLDNNFIKAILAMSSYCINQADTPEVAFKIYGVFQLIINVSRQLASDKLNKTLFQALREDYPALVVMHAFALLKSKLIDYRNKRSEMSAGINRTEQYNELLGNLKDYFNKFKASINDDDIQDYARYLVAFLDKIGKTQLDIYFDNDKSANFFNKPASGSFLLPRTLQMVKLINRASKLVYNIDGDNATNALAASEFISFVYTLRQSVKTQVGYLQDYDSGIHKEEWKNQASTLNSALVTLNQAIDINVGNIFTAVDMTINQEVILAVNDYLKALSNAAFMMLKTNPQKANHSELFKRISSCTQFICQLVNKGEYVKGFFKEAILDFDLLEITIFLTTEVTKVSSSLFSSQVEKDYISQLNHFKKQIIDGNVKSFDDIDEKFSAIKDNAKYANFNKSITHIETLITQLSTNYNSISNVAEEFLPNQEEVFRMD